MIRKSLLLAALVGMGLSSARALPCLQLDIVNGFYVGGSEESTFSNGPIFTVQGLLDLTPRNSLSNPFYLAVAVIPGPGMNVQSSVGTFSVNGVTYSVSGANGTTAMTFGTPPVDVPDTSNYGNMASHGVYPTYYAEIGFNFNANDTVAAYNVQTDAAAPGVLYVANFNVNATNLLAGYSLHFDLYDERVKKGSWTIDDFAPFSHDAEMGGGHPVPDGGTIAGILGAAMLCLVTLRRRK